MNGKITLLGLAALCAILAACASVGTQTQSGKQEETIVVVDNRAFLDMTIYVLRSGQRIRIGQAQSLAKTRLTIPHGIVFGSTQLRFLADPIGSNRTPVSEEITVTEGDEVTLVLPPA